jgi:antagonist of KipI
LLENDENEAVLEMHFPASDIKFEENAVITLGGADFGASINGQKISNWQTVAVEKGQILSFSAKNFGSRCYLAVKAGFVTEKWLNSASANLTAGVGKPLQKDDKIEFKSKNQKYRKLAISRTLVPDYSKTPRLRVTTGAEFDLLNGLSELNFFSKSFKIESNSDRMGFRLGGEPLYLLENRELVSAAVNFGTVQLLPDGQLIILMADHQTTGGYPRIANVISEDLPLLAQLQSGDTVSFDTVSIANAEDLALKFERDLSFLKVAIRLL